MSTTIPSSPEKTKLLADAPRRRSQLRITDNVHQQSEYLVTLREHMAHGNSHVEALIRYIPHHTLLIRDSLPLYLAQYDDCGWLLESMAAAMLDDFNNELVPRWVHVTLSWQEGEEEHRVTLEDRQPKWDNPSLLSRLQPV